MNGQFDNYTNIVSIGNNICVRVRDPLSRQPLYYKVPYQPKTFTMCALNDATDNWRTLDGHPLRMYRHHNLSQYHETAQAAQREGRLLYGAIAPVQQFMAENISKTCGVPFESLRTVFLDIEVGSDGGFAPPEDPQQPIIAITAEVWGHYYVWGLGQFQTDRTDLTYMNCRSEADLLYSFLSWWTRDYPDVVTGWNTHMYDIPYIINRIDRLRDEGKFKIESKVLSPWRRLSFRIATIMGRENHIVDIAGIPILDYLELYRKFSLVQQESYRLDAIAEVELGKKKVSYEEYGTLERFASGNPDIKDDEIYEKGSVQHAAQLRKKLANILNFGGTKK